MNKAKKVILVADDDIDYLFQMQVILQGWGYEVITADSQREAELIIAKMKPDIALFDLMMENEDSGFILSYKMKKTYPDVPVIIGTAVTAETGLEFDAEEISGQQWIKADRFLEKGVDLEVLKKEIENLLNKE